MTGSTTWPRSATRRSWSTLPEGTAWEKNAHGVFECADPARPREQPGRCPSTATPPRAGAAGGHNVYFGDLHTHSQFSNDCIEREKLLRTPADLYAYAREVACLDFHCVTDHHQPWDVPRNRIGADLWEQTLAGARAEGRPGEFLAFTGFEYRGPRGDTAVVLGEELDYDTITQPGYRPVDRLWEGLAGRDFITIPHFHNGGGLKDGEWICANDLRVEPVMEIYSCHGSYEAERVNERYTSEIKRRRPDRNGRWFLKNGYRYGFCANSDGHKGTVGTNGLTAVLAKELTVEAVLEAIRARRCYGTSNARIVLDFTVNGAPMGGELPQAARRAWPSASPASARFKAVDLLKDGDLLQRWKPGADCFSHRADRPAGRPAQLLRPRHPGRQPPRLVEPGLGGVSGGGRLSSSPRGARRPASARSAPGACRCRRSCWWRRCSRRRACRA